jgi:hypothetical protein
MDDIYCHSSPLQAIESARWSGIRQQQRLPWLAVPKPPQRISSMKHRFVQASPDATL